jgi:hypothetical protein
VAFILLKRPGEALSDAELDKMGAIVDTAVSSWSSMTGGRGSLVNRSAIGEDTGDGNSGESTETFAQSKGCGCAGLPAGGSLIPVGWLGLLGGGLLIGRRRLVKAS